MQYLVTSILIWVAAGTASAAVTITDFNYWTPGSSYGSWAPDQGATLGSEADRFNVSATNFGGAYKYLGATGAAPNITGQSTLSLSVTVNSQSNGDAGIGFLILLEDVDGTVHRYSRFGVREGEHTLTWAVDTPSSVGEAGSVPGFDVSHIQGVNIQIDPGGANSYNVSFRMLQAGSGTAAPTASSSAPSAAAPVAAGPSYRTMRDQSYVDQPDNPRYANCRMDIYYPEHLKGFPTVVFMHAGGLRAGERYIPGEIMNKGFAVASISYSLYPNASAPDFIEDAAAAVAWVFKNIENVRGSSDKIFVSGSSAGGYLAKMVGLDKRWLSAHGIDANRLAGIISLSGQAITHVAIREERGGNRAKPVVDDLAPLNHVRADAPPLLLVTGDREMELLGRYEENAYLKRMMEVNGHKQTELHEIKGADHAGVEKPGHDFLAAFVQRVAGA